MDVRGNGGGFVSPLVIERLRRALVMVEMSRNGVPQSPVSTTIGLQDDSRRTHADMLGTGLHGHEDRRPRIPPSGDRFAPWVMETIAISRGNQCKVRAGGGNERRIG